MVNMEVKIPVDTSQIDALTMQVETASERFKNAPDDDPFKIAMADFGEIEIGRHVSTAITKVDGAYVATVTVCDELQDILNMVSDHG